MPITFNCACGKTLRVNDDLAGRKARCPVCQSVVDIPFADADPGFEVVEDEPPRPLLARPIARPKPPPPQADHEPAFDDDRPFKAKKADARRIEEDDAEERRRARRRRKRDREDDDYEDEDEFDRAERRRAMGKAGRRRNRPGEWHAARVGTLIGGILCLLLFGGACYYYAVHSDHRRADSRAFGAGVAAVFSLVGIGRAVAGKVAEDE